MGIKKQSFPHHWSHQQKAEKISQVAEFISSKDLTKTLAAKEQREFFIWGLIIEGSEE